MSTSQAELEQFKTQLTGMREGFLQKIRDQRETGTMLVGDVNPDNIVRKADEYEQMCARPNVTEEELKSWMDEHTSGAIERGLIFTTIYRRGTELSLGKVNEILSADLPDENLRKYFLDLQDLYLGNLPKIDQTTDYFHTIASGFTVRREQLDEIEEVLQNLTLD
ncbi:MAG: hypothetical protein ACD_51C00252G0004 [uncultured bacterium]|uniref:Uncharacterized protein n=2 Tax=Candidatus Chisholmiibacteriota TaxID=1817900 RepID=A0A1G1VMB5_9BACT|nr:MAG: hypothetical protein ACD_51C00252G0004 [uncultured bacterium]OGY16550.1 MAG: hypothetical protein A2785_03085 [Candidatus Chisholmbacteria bacterium RIFCSPHIGHO2_01_FULL_49_18]OGY20991.1 MAG: hypothetical protein A3A65_01615 [Candidatus Chisholmbacteria bacterium RIFCSPLOWO2_01_FULL_49_14]